MIVIDQYSLVALPIEMYFNDTLLSQGTGFVWIDGDSFFLITNWHNVSGRTRTQANTYRLLLQSPTG